MSLPRFFLPKASIPSVGALIPLEPAQARHLWVLRLGAGAAVELVMPTGPWRGDLAELAKDHALVRLVGPLTETREPHFPIHAWLPLTRQLSLLDELLPPLVATGLLLYGLWLLGSFQKQERPWRNALDRARLFALTNFGLSPFLYWWNRLPNHPFFGITVSVLALSSLLFLLSLNLVLQRLGEMLPDESLRIETRQYTALNRNLLVILLIAAALCLATEAAADLRLAVIPPVIAAVLVFLLPLTSQIKECR